VETYSRTDRHTHTHTQTHTQTHTHSPFYSKIKPEPLDDGAHMQCYFQSTSEYTLSEAYKAEPVQTLIDGGCIMYIVNDDNQSLAQMCDGQLAQSKVIHSIPHKEVCIKHEETYCDDDTHLSASPLKTVDGDECRDTGDKPHTCHHCTKSFSTKSKLVVHIRVHTGDKPYTCDLCMKSFSQKNSLVEHGRVHTGLIQTTQTTQV
jgi:hypothetical protein